MIEIQSKNERTRHGGGPHNLGDPNDKYLRKVEKDVLIPQKMRDKAKEEKCSQQVKEFSECCRKANFLMGFKCQKENSSLKECLSLWYNDLDFKEQCTQEYLNERSEYRRTGMSQKPKYTRYQSSSS